MCTPCLMNPHLNPFLFPRRGFQRQPLPLLFTCFRISSSPRFKPWALLANITHVLLAISPHLPNRLPPHYFCIVIRRVASHHRRSPSAAHTDSHRHRLQRKEWKQLRKTGSYPMQLKLRPRLSLSGGFRFSHDYLYNRWHRPYPKPQPRVWFPVSQIVMSPLLRVCKLHWSNSM